MIRDGSWCCFPDRSKYHLPARRGYRPREQVLVLVVDNEEFSASPIILAGKKRLSVNGGIFFLDRVHRTEENVKVCYAMLKRNGYPETVTRRLFVLLSLMLDDLVRLRHSDDPLEVADTAGKLY
jgi:hypothetical protein